ncbi:MAG: NFACT RNA binding domain-containing protein [Reichenbachiella sp.]|uniref:NFACT RNA binding domain-containing protein n=1 Tax=Reichenbachiella sp. TaxID=2184521 RepID=UPI0032647C07
MQFNYYFLRQLSGHLEHRLVNRRIQAIFSQNKDELIMIFEGDDPFLIKANLDNESSLLSFPESFARARKNSIDLFSQIHDLKVLNIKQFKNERSFSIRLENDFELLFKLHGRHANVILFREDTIDSLFKKSIEIDQSVKLSELDREIDQSDQRLIESEFELIKVYPTFDKHIKNHLKAEGFYDSNDHELKLKILHALLHQLNNPLYYITEVDGIPKLLLFQPKNYLQSFDDPIAASNFLARQFFTNHGLSKLKSKLLAQTKKEIKKSESYLNQTKAKLSEIKKRRGYDELANILMANLHVQVNPQAKEIELFDFYSSQQIKVKIKPNQSLQKNAESMYRKAKNQAKEVEILSQNISAKEKTLRELLKKQEVISSSKDIKSLKSLESSKKEGKNQLESPPFIEHHINGFQVFVGRNAKNNDLLTQKYARKDDLWLHAKDVSGSHVIIRNPKGISIPIFTIEKVAQIAAWHSKRKADTLCPVIYTPKKYVRKPKGSLPGQVLLSKEQVILVKPERISS